MYFACFCYYNTESLPSDPVYLDEEATSVSVSDADTEREVCATTSAHGSAPDNRNGTSRSRARTYNSVGLLKHAQMLISCGSSPLALEDSRFVLPGRVSAASVRIWPGLHIRRQWKTNAVDGEAEVINIDCRVKQLNKNSGPIFSVEAFTCQDQSMSIIGCLYGRCCQ